MAGAVRWQRVSPTMRATAKELRSRQTPAERRLWEYLRLERLADLRFRRQQPIGPYIVDFYCSAAKLVVEVDGAIHEDQVEYDQERDAYLAACGLTVIRFKNEAVFDDLNTVLTAIRRAAAIPETLPSSGEGRRPQAAGRGETHAPSNRSQLKGHL